MQVATLPHYCVENLLLEGVYQLHIPLGVAEKPPETPSQEKGQGVGVSYNESHVQVHAFHVAEGREGPGEAGLVSRKRGEGRDGGGRGRPLKHPPCWGGHMR